MMRHKIPLTYDYSVISKYVDPDTLKLKVLSHYWSDQTERVSALMSSFDIDDRHFNNLLFIYRYCFYMLTFTAISIRTDTYAYVKNVVNEELRLSKELLATWGDALIEPSQVIDPDDIIEITIKVKGRKKAIKTSSGTLKLKLIETFKKDFGQKLESKPITKLQAPRVRLLLVFRPMAHFLFNEKIVNSKNMVAKFIEKMIEDERLPGFETISLQQITKNIFD